MACSATFTENVFDCLDQNDDKIICRKYFYEKLSEQTKKYTKNIHYERLIREKIQVWKVSATSKYGHNFNRKVWRREFERKPIPRCLAECNVECVEDDESKTRRDWHVYGG